MDLPKWNDLDAESLASWRTHPVTSAFLEYIALEADRMNYDAGAQVRKQRLYEAASSAGKAELAEMIWRSCYRTDAVKQDEELEEEFNDPVYRFSKQSGGQRNVGTE